MLTPPPSTFLRITQPIYRSSSEGRWHLIHTSVKQLLLEKFIFLAFRFRAGNGRMRMGMGEVRSAMCVGVRNAPCLVHGPLKLGDPSHLPLFLVSMIAVMDDGMGFAASLSSIVTFRHRWAGPFFADCGFYTYMLALSFQLSCLFELCTVLILIQGEGDGCGSELRVARSCGTVA